MHSWKYTRGRRGQNGAEIIESRKCERCGEQQTRPTFSQLIARTPCPADKAERMIARMYGVAGA